MKILFLFPYPLSESPSQRFRFEQYFAKLSSQGMVFWCNSFWGRSGWKILYNEGRYLLKTYHFSMGFLKRILVFFKIPFADFVFIHRECLPIGPPVMEWLIAKILRKKIVYDFDDAIWLPNTSTENRMAGFIKWHSKVALICKWSYKISCGNSYLAEFARQFNKNVVINPTTIDTECRHNPALYKLSRAEENIITIGWTGSHSTLKYLDLITPVIQQMEKQFENFRFVIIADRKPTLPLKSLVFVPWAKETEIEDLLKIDIGIMPLSDDIWARGKCGFKALQYMALEIPTLASPIGVNTEIIDDSVNGFLCQSEEDWFNRLSYLIAHPDARCQMGNEGRKKVVKYYSTSSNSSTFLSLFE